MRQAVTLSEGGTEALAALAQSYASAGYDSAARSIVSKLNGSEKRYVSPCDIARIYGSLAEPDRALEWLVKAYEEHNDSENLNFFPKWRAETTQKQAIVGRSLATRGARKSHNLFL
ncbi:MAG: hypothetical protein ACYDBZ_16070 [Steroidobacteraceae bacterium]